MLGKGNESNRGTARCLGSQNTLPRLESHERDKASQSEVTTEKAGREKNEQMGVQRLGRWGCRDCRL